MQGQANQFFQVLQGGWPHLNSEKRFFVAGAAPYGSQGAGVDFLSAWGARHLEGPRFPNRDVNRNHRFVATFEVACLMDTWVAETMPISTRRLAARALALLSRTRSLDLPKPFVLIRL
jgi:hypothetical protein